MNSKRNRDIISNLKENRGKRERKGTAMMSQRSRGACSALRISRISEASLGSWSSATLTSSSEFCTGMYTQAIDFDYRIQQPKLIYPQRRWCVLSSFRFVICWHWQHAWLSKLQRKQMLSAAAVISAHDLCKYMSFYF